MHSLLFSFEASLLAPLLEFALSPSGHVEPRRGLALGWLGSVVAGLAVMLARRIGRRPLPTAADYTSEIANGDALPIHAITVLILLRENGMHGFATTMILIFAGSWVGVLVLISSVDEALEDRMPVGGLSPTLMRLFGEQR